VTLDSSRELCSLPPQHILLIAVWGRYIS